MKYYAKILLTVCKMAQIGNDCHVLAWQIAPVLATILPDFLVRVGSSFMCVARGHIVVIVVYFHEGSTGAWRVLRVVSIVTYPDLVILKVLPFIGVLMWRKSIVKVLYQHYAVLEEFFA